jgi:hypothetical protein
MKFLSLEPFVPSGADYEGSKKLFQELGFNLTWDAGSYAGFEKDGCRFILQHYEQKNFAENFMLSVKVDNVETFRQMVLDKELPQKYGIRVGNVCQQPYGKDIAGVCWHFVE